MVVAGGHPQGGASCIREARLGLGAHLPRLSVLGGGNRGPLSALRSVPSPPHPHPPRPGKTRAKALATCYKDGQPGEGAERQTPLRLEATEARNAQQGFACLRGSAGSPHLRPCARGNWGADPGYVPRGQPAGRGRAPNPRRPSQRQEVCESRCVRHGQNVFRVAVNATRNESVTRESEFRWPPLLLTFDERLRVGIRQFLKLACIV